MTSNERKILECVWDHGGKAHIQHVAHRTKLSSGYSLFLCRSLAKAGHLEFVNPNVCKLAEKGYGHFQDYTGIEVVVASSTPQEESTYDPALSSTISDDKDAEPQEDENIGEPNKDQEARLDPAVRHKDEDEGKTDSDPPAGDGGAASELKGKIPENDHKFDEKGIEKLVIKLMDKVGLAIKKFSEFSFQRK